MNEAWAPAGLKSTYESGELIVLHSPHKSTELNSPLYLTREGQTEQVSLDIKTGAGEKKFVEFYAVDPGTYTLSSIEGRATFEVVPRQDLSFHKEFGIFFTASLLLILLMAWRYLNKRKATVKGKA